MLDIFVQFFDFFLFVALIAVGYVAGRLAEASHYRSIRAREQALARVLVFANRLPPPDMAGSGRLVSGSVVVAEDYFKRVVGVLYSFIGGRLKSYESLLDRARREAVLRMKREANQAGASMIVNVKFQTFSMTGRRGGAVEVLAWGTALVPPRPAPAAGR